MGVFNIRGRVLVVPGNRNLQTCRSSAESVSYSQLAMQDVEAECSIPVGCLFSKRSRHCAKLLNRSLGPIAITICQFGYIGVQSTKGYTRLYRDI